MQNNNPFFSVIIATYNRAHLIERALKSLIAQTETSWEGVIIDDGSTDGTSEKIVSYMENYSSFSFIKQSHLGMAAAKNKGIETAKGKYVTFLDSDDEFHPLHLETRMSVLQEHPTVSFLYGRVKVLGNPYVPDRFNTNKMISLDQCIIGGSFVIERNTADLLKGFRNIDIGADADLFDRARCAGVQMMEVYLPTYIYHHDHEDSLTNQRLIKLS